MQKRFIAGAVCPRCGEMDRLVTYESDNAVFKECVSCGFSEKQLAQVVPKELGTRVNKNEASVTEDRGEVIKIMQPPSK